MTSRKARRDARVAQQMRGRDLPKARLYYTYVYPIFNWVHGVLYGIRAWATFSPITRFHQVECDFSGLTLQQEIALLHLGIGFVEGFDGFIAGGVKSSMLLGSTDEQATVFLGVLQAFVEGFGGMWISGKSYAVDENGDTL